MLSIRLTDDREWWVSGAVFERLFTSALAGGELAPDLEEWRHVADANGGLGLDLLDPVVARQIAAGLRAAASRDLERLADAPPDSPDGDYRASLSTFLAISGPDG